MTSYLSSSATDDSPATTAFAPPVLLHKGNVISQTTAILGYLDAVLPPIDLELEAGVGKESRRADSRDVWAKNALMQTIVDCVAEVSGGRSPKNDDQGTG